MKKKAAILFVIVYLFLMDSMVWAGSFGAGNVFGTAVFGDGTSGVNTILEQMRKILMGIGINI